MECNERRCTLSTSLLTPFLIQSQNKRPGETLEPSDQFYFTDTSGLLLQCTAQNCFLSGSEPGTSNLFSTVIERRGWSEWETVEECTGTCGDSYQLYTRYFYSYQLYTRYFYSYQLYTRYFYSYQLYTRYFYSYQLYTRYFNSYQLYTRYFYSYQLYTRYFWLQP